ncbi:FKBP-type peptidyl-prolyl cis-trans isomerase [Pseudomaricurvus sp.]|uniref:FKBP-type peptidyl-prolyl cis-trans isomerase n=1 Tax=Pseudomaricurvus sp. TaxID=2004510 RepID=UPI003F6A9AE6
MKRYTIALAIMVMSATLMSTHSQHAQAKGSIQPEQDQIIESSEQLRHLKTLTDRFSYAYGADLAEKFKVEGIELNIDVMATAMQDVFIGDGTKMSNGEIASTMEMYRKVHIKKKEEERAIAGEKNKKEGAIFLADNAKKPGVTTTESGLQYRIINKGSGGQTPTEDDEVKVNYRGTFIDGTEFDSTYSRNEAFSVKAKALIDGWAEALQMMTEGSKWELYIPAELAYGERGSSPYIGPNAVLIFEVELLDIEKG